jgi:hypothetical protein
MLSKVLFKNRNVLSLLVRQQKFSTSLLFDSYDGKKISTLKPKEKDEFLFTSGLWNGRDVPLDAS